MSETVSLVEVTSESLREVLGLEVAPGQESFVALNAGGEVEIIMDL